MLPFYIAYMRGRTRQGLILILNILLGWTGFVWLALFVVAFMGEDDTQRGQRVANEAMMNNLLKLRTKDLQNEIALYFEHNV